MKKIIFVIAFLLTMVSMQAQTIGTNGIVSDIKLLIDKDVTLDSANSSVTDSAFFNTSKFSLDADSVAFIVSITGDSTTKRSGNYSNVRIMGKIEWLNPVMAKSIYKWSEYSPDSTAFISKAPTTDAVTIYTYALTKTTSRVFANLHILLANADATKKKINLKVWIIKYWRKT